MCDVQEGAMAPIDGLPGKRRQNYPPQYSTGPMPPGARNNNTLNSGHMIEGPPRGLPPPPPPGYGQYPLQNSSGREGKRPIMTREPPPRFVQSPHSFPTPRGPHNESNSKIEFRRASAHVEPPSAQSPMPSPPPPAIVNNSQAVMPSEQKVQNSGAPQETLTAGHNQPRTPEFDFNHKTLEIVIPVQGHGTLHNLIREANGLVHIRGDIIKVLIKDELNNKKHIKDFGQEKSNIDLRNAFIVKAEIGAVDNKYQKPFYPSISLGDKNKINEESSNFFNKKRLITSEGDKPFSIPYAFRIPAEYTSNEKTLIREREIYANDPYVLRHHGETSAKIKQYLDLQSINTAQFNRVGVDTSSILYSFLSNPTNISWCERAFAEQGIVCDSKPKFASLDGVEYAYYPYDFLAKALETYLESRDMILSVKDLTEGITVKFNTYSSSKTLDPTFDAIDCKTNVQAETLMHSKGVVYFELYLTLRIPLGVKSGPSVQEIETSGQKFMRCMNSSGKFFDDDANQTTT